MPRPSGQQMHPHPQQQRYEYEPYNAHPGRNAYGHPRAIHHHPYARPGHSTPAGPGYDYYNKQRMISPPQAISPAHQSPADAAAAATETKKKPPRPYTEYNIFFQLERDRILTELEDKKNEEGGEGDEEPSSPKERILNQPSDENDILPRPPQFAHLKLMPKWYDSTVRIAQNKLNKSKRKHRKTHGLVGFLDLTKMISKAWAAADAETKGYCKRVADRQLGFYKDELKAIKQQRTDQQQHQQLMMGQQHQAAQNMPLPHMRNDGSHGFHNRMPMTHPPPPHYWQHQQDMSPHAAHTGPSYPEQFPRTPPSQETYIEDQRYQGRPSDKMHPLEELMLRRRMYGNRSNSAAPRRSHAAWPSHPMQTVVGSGGESLPHSQPYVSPAETGTVAKEAVTPSPPRKQDPSTPTLPVKKRLKKEEPADISKGSSPASLGSGDILESGGSTYNSSPISASFPSPSEMMMNNVFNGSPLSSSSYQRALGPYLTDSPLPYMDFSPQESIGSPMRHPSTVPSHLALPGSYAATDMRAPHQRGGRTPFMDDLANDILDFDEEEMDYMWNKLASSARARRNAKVAAANELFRMNHDASGIASPGNMNVLGLAHSFASPAAPSDVKDLSPCATAATAPPLPPVDEEKHDSLTENDSA
mmetsp:Transcript_4111/g.7052  ORF Transcript_4111/g.7052 Transcript_4111/m.7052 type:complete len:644 (-) Transcript_4111:653-2584(-)